MISNIDAGRLDQRITLLEPTKTLNTGSHTLSYKDNATVWANVKQLTLRETISSNVELQTETYTILLRYRSGITQDWCVRLPNQKRYRIISINTDKTAGAMILGIELDNSIVQKVTS